MTKRGAPPDAYWPPASNWSTEFAQLQAMVRPMDTRDYATRVRDEEALRERETKSLAKYYDDIAAAKTRNDAEMAERAQTAAAERRRMGL
jgi:hypothetical protein